MIEDYFPFPCDFGIFIQTSSQTTLIHPHEILKKLIKSRKNLPLIKNLVSYNSSNPF